MTPPPVPSQRNAAPTGGAGSPSVTVERHRRAIVVQGLRFLIEVEAVRVTGDKAAKIARWCDGLHSTHLLSSGETLVAISPEGTPDAAGAGDYIVRFLRNDIDPEVVGTFGVFTAAHLANFTRLAP